ncbi:YciI family protein [Thermoactinospora rubra]|uniref:YciI family protein n=1 Tax=Thermoactinospora rubra TaxID=1088767 RepID=UPI000A0FF8BA|nr:YciI family protein [Thermoactinospora rubra]
MKYLLLCVGDEAPWAQAGPQERKAIYEQWGAYTAMLRARGAERGGNELAHSSTATTIRKSGGQVLITDGPYAETVEQISGYVLIEARDLQEALELAKAQPGDVEIRPVMDTGPDIPPGDNPGGVRYALLIYGDESAWEQAGPEDAERAMKAHGDYTALLRERNAYLGGEALQPSATALTVRKKDREVMVTDGPFAETVEHLGGYYEIAARDLDEAIELAKALPEDIVEVRPVVEYQG